MSINDKGTHRRIVTVVKLGSEGDFVSLTDDQWVFLLNEFGICESCFFELAPLKFWMLREECLFTFTRTKR